MHDDTEHDQQSDQLPDRDGNMWGSFFEFVKTIGFIFVVAFLIRQWLVQPFVVDGESMEPNFHHQDYILVDKLSYRFAEPKRGDVIVFHPPNQEADNFIKRIIGLPGETVEVKGDAVFVNGVQMSESYLGVNDFPPVDTDSSDITRRLGANEFFVLGDNRDHSKDSREIGPIPAINIIGRAMIVLFPLDDIKVLAAPLYTPYSTQNDQALVHGNQGHTS